MSFFSRLRHTLGFSDDFAIESDNNSVLADDNQESGKEAENEAGQQTDCEEYADAREAIFCHVVDVFNGSLPDFLARSVNPEAQRRLLYEKLDQGLKDYLAKIGSEADSRCEMRWTSEQESMRSEMQELKRKSEQVVREKEGLKQKQLSADRQKRALNERMKDLEKQVGALAAEREQLDLENKSLLNKLKVASVNGGSVVVDIPAETPHGPSQEEFDAISAECGRLREALEQAADRQKMADEIAADLRKRLSVAQQEVEDLQSITEQVAFVQTAIEERDATLERQRGNIKKLKEQIEQIKENSAMAEKHYRERESELLRQLEDLKTPGGTLSQTAESPVEFNTEKTTAPKAGHSPRKRKTRKSGEPENIVAPKITDDDLNDVEAGFADHDWFGAPEEPETPVAASSSVPDDFGYHAPEPKPRPYDDGMQMSLFD